MHTPWAQYQSVMLRALARPTQSESLEQELKSTITAFSAVSSTGSLSQVLEHNPASQDKVPMHVTAMNKFSCMLQSSTWSQAPLERHIPLPAQYCSIPQSSVVMQVGASISPSSQDFAHIPESQVVVPTQPIDMKELSTLKQSVSRSQAPAGRQSPFPAQYSSRPQSWLVPQVIAGVLSIGISPHAMPHEKFSQNCLPMHSIIGKVLSKTMQSSTTSQEPFLRQCPNVVQ
jgi:hypothetical protein